MLVIAAMLGFLAGFFAAIPVAGPVGALVVSRAADQRYRSGMRIALGSALVDVVYAALALLGFGAAVAESALVTEIGPLVAAGLLVVVGIALARYQARPAVAAPARRAGTRCFALGLAMTAINPGPITTWAAIAAALVSAGLLVLDAAAMAGFALGVGLGTVAWFALLIELARRFEGRFGAEALRPVVRGTGAVLAVAGLALGLGALV